MVTKVQRRYAAEKRKKASDARKARAAIGIKSSWKKATDTERKKLLKIMRKDFLEARKDSHAARKARREAERERRVAFKKRREAAKLRRKAAAKRRKEVEKRKTTASTKTKSKTKKG